MRVDNTWCLADSNAVARRVFGVGIWLLVCGLGAGICLLVDEAASADEVPAHERRAPSVDFFESRIRPLLIEHCYECHSGDSDEGGLRVDSLAALLRGGERGPAIVPGKPDESLLIGAVRHGELLKMPPKRKLSTRQLADLEQWVTGGAVWPGVSPPPSLASPKPTVASQPFSTAQRSHWSFQRPRKPPLPEVSDPGWAQSPIDRFIQDRLAKQGMSPAPPAERVTLLRRATFDITGLPPTPEQIADFVHDRSPDAFARVVDRLLNAPQYGERWARHWLDVARYADSNGLDENLAYANAFRYRDFVIGAFNLDLPYNTFIRYQLAGDLVSQEGGTADDLNERLIATGFLSLGAKMLAEDDPVKMQMDIIDEQVDTIGRAFMGLTLGCARCHDHKFDPITMADYYGLAGILKSTRTMETHTVVARWQERPLGRPEVVRARDKLLAEIADMDKRVQQTVDHATQQLLRAARRHAGDYLLATLRAEHRERRQAGLKPPGDEKRLVAQAPDAKPVEIRPTGGGDPPLAVLVDQWRKYLADSTATPAGVFGPWRAFVESGKWEPPSGESTELYQRLGSAPPANEVELAHRYGGLFLRVAEEIERRAVAGQPTQPLPDPVDEALRAVLYDAGGPFAAPPSAQSLEDAFPAETRAELQAARRDRAAAEAALPQLPEAMAVSEGSPEELRIHIRGSHLALGDVAPRRFPQLVAGDLPLEISPGQSGRRELADWLTSGDNPLVARVLVNRVWQWHFGDGLVRSPDNFGLLGEQPTHPELLDWLAVQFVESGWSLKWLHRTILLSATYQMSSDGSPAALERDPDHRFWWRFPRRRLDAESVRDAALAVADQLDFRMGGSLLPTPNRKYVTSTANVNPVVYETNRRSVYLPVVRSALYEVFQAFDFADPSVSQGRRESTTVAPQALFMMNSQLIAAQSLALAQLLLGDPTLDDCGRVGQLFARVLGRTASDDEVHRSLAFVTRYSQQLAQHAEVTPAGRRLRAWQSLCRAILSTNEFVFVD